MSLTVLTGDWVEQSSTLSPESVQCCVTSPPYWGLRDYKVKGQLGLEKTPEEYVSKLVAGFREVRRVLKDDGTLWLNLGDSYAAGGMGGHNANGSEIFHGHSPRSGDEIPKKAPPGYKPKDLVGIPWMVAFALRADGWYLRQDIIWNKSQTMPESVTDRCTKAHEYIFLLTKSPRYYYDQQAIMEPCVSGPSDLKKMIEDRDRIGGKHLDIDDGLNKASSLTNIGKKRGVGGTPLPDVYKGSLPGRHNGPGQDRRRENPRTDILMRNKRSVWTVATSSFSGAHFATFPPDLIKPCILAGSKAGDTILDPFGGSGTTAAVALELGRNALTIELNPDYVKLIQDRTNITKGLAL